MRENILHLLSEISFYFSNIKEEISRPYGINELEFSIITLLYKKPKNNRVSDICKALNKNTNIISPTITKLVERGFLLKKQSAKDKRCFYVFLTEEGNKLAINLVNDVVDYSKPIFKNINDNDLSEIEEGLKILLKAVIECDI